MNKREKEVIQLQLKAEEDVIKELEKQYKAALAEINQKVKLFQFDIDMLDEAINADGLDETAKAVLQSQKRSKIYQKQYQEALQGQVSGILDRMQGNNYSTIESYLKQSYEDAYIGTMYDIHGQGIPLVMPIDQAAAVKAIMTDSKISKGLYNALGVDVNGLKKAIRQEITRGIGTGLLYNEIARNIANRAKAPLSRAKVIVRTEGHRIQQQSADDARKGAIGRGCDVVKQWDAALDGKTRDNHRRLDGQIREQDEPFEVAGKKAMFPGEFGDPAEDCNCRCVALTRARWALDEDELNTLKERAEYFGLDKAKDIEDYKQKYLKAAEDVPKTNKKETNAKSGSGNIQINQASDENIKTAAQNIENTKIPLENSANGATIEYGEYPEYSRIISRLDDVEGVKKVNPNYSKLTYEYMNNCQRCVPAWELRQRGYDVIAQPCKPINEHDALKTSPFNVWNFNAFDKDTSKRVQRDREGNGKEKIIEFLKECGNGARVEITVQWEFNPDGGHAFAAKNVNGTILFLDPQSGKSGQEVEDYFTMAVMGETRWLRIDELSLAEQFRKEVIANPYEKPV